MSDDRIEFELMKRQQASGMAADVEIKAQARDLLVAADRHGWSYQWTWLGLPIIQLPTDLVAMQEVIWATKPDLIVETGVARGGSLVFFASVLQLLGKGEVLGVDIDIRPHNRAAIEMHPMAKSISLIEGSSTSEEVMQQVLDRVTNAQHVMVVLDSNHTHEHVLLELRLYAPLVTPGQYLIVCDTVVEELPYQEHRPRPWRPGNNSATALAAFLESTNEFEVDKELNDKLLISSSPGGYLRRRFACEDR